MKVSELQAYMTTQTILQDYLGFCGCATPGYLAVPFIQDDQKGHDMELDRYSRNTLMGFGYNYERKPRVGIPGLRNGSLICWFACL